MRHRGLLVLVLLLCLPSLSWSVTYYAGAGGSNANPCTGAGGNNATNRNFRKLTINGGIGCLGSGDTLLITLGTYDEILSDIGGPGGYPTVRPPNGTSWSAVTTIKAETALQVTMRPLAASGGGWNTIIEFDDATTQYLQIEGLILDGQHKATGTASCVGVWESHHIRFKDVHLKDADQGIQGTAYNYEILTSEVSGHGYDASGTDTCAGGSEPYPGFCHGFYLRGSGHLFDGLHVHNNSGNGFQLYASDCTVRNTFMHDNKGHGIWFLGSSGTAYNNVLARNCGAGIEFDGGTNVAVGNTITEQAPDPPACVSGYIFGITTGSPASTTIKNNLITNIPGTGDKAYIYASGGTGATGNYYADNSLNTSLVTGNICSVSGMVGCTTQVGTNATFFANAAGGDYHNAAGAPQINAGVTLGSPYTTDKDGNARSVPWDIGAYETVSQTPVATSLAWIQQPATTAVGATIIPAPSVQVLDQFGTPFSTSLPITVALSANPGGATLSGPTLVTSNAAGLATFSPLSLNVAASGYILVATSPGLLQAFSASFTVVAAVGQPLGSGVAPDVVQPWSLPLTDPAVHRQHPVLRGLRGWWRVLRPLFGGSRLWDLVGSQPATLTGMTPPADGWNLTRRGGADGEVRLTTSAALLLVAPHARLDALQTYTYVAWIKPTTFGGGSKGYLVLRAGPVQDGPLLSLLDTSPGTQGLRLNVGFSGGGGSWHADNAVTLGTWQQVAVTYDNRSPGNTPLFYRDGLPLTTTTDAVPSGTAIDDTPNDMTFGHSNLGDDTRTFVGALDDLMVFDRLLTAEELTALKHYAEQGWPGVLTRYPLVPRSEYTFALAPKKKGGFLLWGQ
jgi:hypothetical protein